MMPKEHDKDQAVDSTSRRNKGRLVQHILVAKIIFPSNNKKKKSMYCDSKIISTKTFKFMLFVKMEVVST
jgi:hypothetical protein